MSDNAVTPDPKNATNPNGQATVRPAMPFATVDHDRARRCGNGEVVYGAGKTPEEVVGIVGELLEHGQPAVLITRTTPEQMDALRSAMPDRPIEASTRSGAVIVGTPVAVSGTVIPIVAAGTSDLAVAEEAAMTCKALGHVPAPINDVGVAGVHRLLGRLDEVKAGHCVIVVAGMEGALPSVVGGLVDVPVIACPTSVGYGTSFGGLSALLGMLNSCASGVTVVNIDNGFGAAYAACQINRQVERAVADRGDGGSAIDGGGGE